MNRMKAFKEGGMPFEAEKFRNVPIELAPIYGWNFNDRLDKGTIKKQIDGMARAGIRVIYVLPEPKNFRTSIPTALEPDYLSDGYMDYFSFAVEYAKKKGMLMWLYDEGGWPSGSACGEVYRLDPSTAKKFLSEERLTVGCGEIYNIPEDAVAVFAGGKRLTEGFTASAETELTEYRIADGSTEHTEIGNRKTPYERAVSFVGNTDINEPRTVELFLKTTHERYRDRLGEEFGKNLLMMFTDEPRPAAFSWFNGIEDAFFKRYGYSLTDNLPALFGGGGDAEQVRIDYHDLCGDRLREVYFDRIRKWCNENGLYFCGHVDLDNRTDGGAVMNYGSTLNLLRGMDVPGVDVIWRQIYPFSDGRRVDSSCTFFPRMASSAASQSGGNLSLTESLGVYGLGVTMDEMRYIFNYQAIRGINLMNPLLISYGTREHFGFGERPYFNAEIPGHDDLPLLNDYYARISYLTATGRRNVRTALYISTDDLNAGGERCERFAREFDTVGARLEAEGVDFDIIDSRGILAGTLDGGVLRLGAAEYDCITVPSGAVLTDRVKDIISSLKGTPVSLIRSDIGFNDMRVSSRIFDNGDVMYLLFNEGLSPLDGNIEIDDTRNSHILDPRTGDIYESEKVTRDGVSRIHITLSHGEMLGILFTGEELKEKKRTAYIKTQELCDFKARGVRKFVIDTSGFYDVMLDEEFRDIKLGDWSEVFGKDFSGEAEYRAQVNLEETVKHAKLSLGKLCYSASVYVNNSFAGYAGISPCEVEIDAGFLKCGENEIVIRVANTAANQMLYSDAENNWSAAELTPYNDRARLFEEDSLESGLFGPILLMTE